MYSFVLNLNTIIDRRVKLFVLFLMDTILMVSCFVSGMALRLEHFQFLRDGEIWLPFAVATSAALIGFAVSGLYRSLIRFLTGRVLFSVGVGSLIFAITLFFTSQLSGAFLPRSVPVIAAVLLFLAMGSARFLIRSIFRRPNNKTQKGVVVYGAGEAGRELCNALFHGPEYRVVGIIDDDPRIQGLHISGYRVRSPDVLADLARRHGVEVVLLALPGISHSRRREIFNQVESLNLEIKTVPSMSDLVSGKANVSQLRDVSEEDLLGREPVEPMRSLLKANISDKVVMVTGAGGSIGSELCRQILTQQPKTMVLFEISELALYTIENELLSNAESLGCSTTVVPVLGSVQNAKRVGMMIDTFKVDTIYHAAAYKHVPLVEENVAEGIRNNVFGTLAVAQAALKYSVKNFILISTDKAVRPTNVMGASKRIAELVVQVLAEDHPQTVFSLVRFGNVLGSSGSVIPRFRSQIESGGPVTVTHREINRYFMTIPEAAQLVIQAGAMGKGGDVFVLDMGRPVKIVDLAVTMVKLHGLTPYIAEHEKVETDKEGDIEICFTGLRKGEKLYEELLLGNESESTQHPRIFTASEIYLPRTKLMPALDRLLAACKDFDLAGIHAILSDLPIEFQPQHNLSVKAVRLPRTIGQTSGDALLVGS